MSSPRADGTLLARKQTIGRPTGVLVLPTGSLIKRSLLSRLLYRQCGPFCGGRAKDLLLFPPAQMSLAAPGRVALGSCARLITTFIHLSAASLERSEPAAAAATTQPRPARVRMPGQTGQTMACLRSCRARPAAARPSSYRDKYEWAELAEHYLNSSRAGPGSKMGSGSVRAARTQRRKQRPRMRAGAPIDRQTRARRSLELLENSFHALPTANPAPSELSPIVSPSRAISAHPEPVRQPGSQWALLAPAATVRRRRARRRGEDSERREDSLQIELVAG